MVRLQGTFSIMRQSDGKITIEFTDEGSGIRFLAATVDAAAFGLAVTGLGYRPCELDLRGLENVGKQREYETREVWISPYEERDVATEQAIAALETDGWQGNRKDTENRHRFIRRDNCGGEWYSVSFHRYVEADP